MAQVVNNTIVVIIENCVISLLPIVFSRRTKFPWFMTDAFFSNSYRITRKLKSTPEILHLV